MLTVLAMILGELVPKSLALQDPTRMALLTVLPMQWSQRLFAPSIALLNGSGVFLLKLLGVTSTGHRHVHSPRRSSCSSRRAGTAACWSRSNRFGCIARSGSACGPRDS